MVWTKEISYSESWTKEAIPTEESWAPESKTTPALLNNYSIAFDGTDDYIEASMTNFCGADFSIGYWVKNDMSPPDYWKGVSTSNRYQDGLFVAYHRILGEDSLGNVFDKAFPAVGGTVGGTYGEWHYHMVTYDISTKTFTLYADDATPTTKTIVGDIKTGEDIFRIGRNYSYYFEGNIDEVAVWDTLLDGDAIKAIYNGGNPIDLTVDNGAYDEYTDNLQGYWRMGDGTLDTYPLIADQVDTTFALLRDDSFSSSAGWNGSITVADGQLTKNNTGLVYRTDISISSGDILRYVVDVETRGAGLTAYVGGTVVSIPSTGLQTIYISTSASNSFVGFNSGNGSVINSVVISKVNGNAGLMTNMASGDIEEDTP
jgi:hypothetical protein